VRKSAEELVVDTPPTNFPATEMFGVGELSLGYIAEIVRWSGATLGLGGMGTVNNVPASLEPTYGSRTPVGLWVFLRIRPLHGPEMQMTAPSMPSMKMP